MGASLFASDDIPAGYTTPIYVTVGGELPMSEEYSLYLWTIAGVIPGKGFIGLRIVRRDDHGLSSVHSLLRLFGHPASTLLCGLGYLWIAIDNRREGWHDRIARTAVIYVKEAHPSTRSLGSMIRARDDGEESPSQEDQ